MVLLFRVKQAYQSNSTFTDRLTSSLGETSTWKLQEGPPVSSTSFSDGGYIEERTMMPRQTKEYLKYIPFILHYQVSPSSITLTIYKIIESIPSIVILQEKEVFYFINKVITMDRIYLLIWFSDLTMKFSYLVQKRSNYEIEFRYFDKLKDIAEAIQTRLRVVKLFL